MRPTVLIIGDVNVFSNGASSVTLKLIDFFRKYGIPYVLMDSSTFSIRNKSLLFLSVVKFINYVRAFLKILLPSSRYNNIYIQLASGPTFVFQFLFVYILSKFSFGISFYLHHHSSSLIETKSFFRSFLFGLICDKSTSIYLTPSMAKNAISKFGTHRNVVVSNIFFTNLANSLAVFDAEKLADRPYRLIFFGSISRAKGADIFVRLAFEGLQAQNSLQIFMAGSCNEPSVLKSIAVLEKNFQDRFEYLPSYDANMLPNLISQHDVFVFPTSYREEAAPLVLYEALSLGVTCIASDAGYISEVIDKDGVVVPWFQLSNMPYCYLAEIIAQQFRGSYSSKRPSSNRSERFSAEFRQAEDTLKELFNLS